MISIYYIILSEIKLSYVIKKLLKPSSVQQSQIEWISHLVPIMKLLNYLSHLVSIFEIKL